MASAETVPTSRPSLGDKVQPDPIALFERHLKYLQDSYLNFFQERARIEEVYVESLLRLHKKTKTTDIYLDHATEPNTVRQVWAEVRDGLEREAQSRSAFLQALTVDVINPITAFKETQDRSRKRIKEDIKESVYGYNEYAENVLPRLKRVYFKKCQEVEDNKASAFSPPAPAGMDAPALAPTRSNPNTSPVVTNPQPLRPLSRRASGHHPQSRNRSPSASNPLHDLAHQGKKQLTQLMTFLDNKGGSLKEGVTGGKSDSAIKTVRAKREADEADKEYRKGVHHFETLRLRRHKILEGAFKSLELFIDETSNQMKACLDKYTGNLMATSTTIGHLATHAQTYLAHISPQKDIAFLPNVKHRCLKQFIPKRTLYTNYYVGDCSDLVFGVSLVDYATARGLPEGDIPKLVKLCIAEVDKRGLSSEGIYRVPGRHAVVQEMIHSVEKDEKNFQLYPSDDIYVVGSLLKQYLRELPEPLFKFALEDRVKHSEDRDEHISSNFVLLRAKLRRLPAIHQATLKALLEHLSRIVLNSAKNKMDAKNLAIIFCGFVFGEDDISKAQDLLEMSTWKDTIMEDLILNAHVLFDENVPTIPPSELLPSSPPLPSVPSEDPVQIEPDTEVRQTDVSDVPQRRQRHDATFGQDFTPELPPRPGNSIHPSHRAMRTPSHTESESDDDEPGKPPLPPRPSSVDMRAIQASEGSTTGSQTSPVSEHHDESFGETEITESSVAPSSPISVRSPVAPMESMEELKKDSADVGTVRPSTRHSADQ